MHLAILKGCSNHAARVQTGRPDKVPHTTIFDAPDRAEADRQLRLAVDKYRKSAPKLSAWLEANIPGCLAVFQFPAMHQEGCASRICWSERTKK